MEPKWVIKKPMDSGTFNSRLITRKAAAAYIPFVSLSFAYSERNRHRDTGYLYLEHSQQNKVFATNVCEPTEGVHGK